jgi:aspartate-semialdehyde dehydrogenase
MQSIAQLNITLIRSAEFQGKPGVDELASQTVNLLNAREVSPSVFPEQIAFNVLPEASDSRLSSDLTRFLGTISYPPVLQTLNVPIFHGFAAAVQLRFASEVALEDCRKLLESVDNLVLKKGPSSPISDCNQSFSGVISQLEQSPDHPASLQFWMIADPMRYGLANNFVNVTEFLLKSFL